MYVCMYVPILCWFVSGRRGDLASQYSAVEFLCSGWLQLLMFIVIVSSLSYMECTLYECSYVRTYIHTYVRTYSVQPCAISHWMGRVWLMRLARLCCSPACYSPLPAHCNICHRPRPIITAGRKWGTSHRASSAGDFSCSIRKCKSVMTHYSIINSTV